MRFKLSNLALSAHKEFKERKVPLDHLSQEQQETLAQLATQVIQEARESQAQQSLERQDPQVLLAQQVLLAAQGLLDPQDQLE
jgi:urease gamma subunit